jgi:hypothetical protein
VVLVVVVDLSGGDGSQVDPVIKIISKIKKNNKN